MKKYNLNLLLGIFTMLLALRSYSQNTFENIIVDSISNTPIPYATIKIKNSNFGTYSDSLGKLILNIKSKSDTLVVFALGYKTKTLIIKEELIKNSRIYLSQSINVLNEVYISNYVNRGTWVKSYHKNKKFCNASLFEGTTLKMKVENLDGNINGLRFYLLYPSSDMTVSVRPVITTLDGKPLLKKDYTRTFSLKFKKNRKIEFEFDENVNIPNDGVFLGLETISVPDNNNYNKTVRLQCSKERDLRTKMTTLKNYVQQNGIELNFDKIINGGIYIEIKRPK